MAGLCQGPVGLWGRVPAMTCLAAWVPPAHGTCEAVDREPCPCPWVTQPRRGATSGPRRRFFQLLPLTPSLALCRLPWTFPPLASQLFPGCGCSVCSTRV